MTRATTAAGLTMAIAIVLASCAALFEDASQCAADGDCERFGAVCDTARNVCVSRAAIADAPTVTDSPPTVDAELDSPPVDPGCNLPNKAREPIASTMLDAGADGGPEGEITGAVTLACTKDWVLRGRLYVRAGATLTIQPGTTIRAEPGTDAALVVLPGGKIIAAGTAEAPIVLTSDAATPAAGDWQGVFVLGVAPTKAGASPYVGDPALIFGGVNADDDSGSLRFVRIEYGALGAVFGGVGRRTKLDSIEVRKTTDNCFTFHGGNVDVKHLVCQLPFDDMIEYGYGYSGRMQFFFGQKTPGAGVVGAHGLLVDDCSPVIYNATVCGDSEPVLGYALVPRNAPTQEVNNAIFTGWNGGVDTIGAQNAASELRSSIAFANAGNPGYAETPAEGDTTSPLFDDDFGFDEVAWFQAAERGNAETDPALVACFDAASPKPWPAVAITAGARTPPASADAFFDTSAAFVGAFRDANDAWMRGAWVRFSND